MKKLFRILLVAGFALFASNLAKAQGKIGYVYFNTVVEAMPENAAMVKQVQDYQKQFIDVLQGMQADLQAKNADYQKNKSTWSDALRSQKEGELANLQSRMEEYSNNAQSQVEAKHNALLKPIVDKAKAAITEVSKEKGYGFIFDASQPILLVSPLVDDLTAAVKLKLGIK